MSIGSYDLLIWRFEVNLVMSDMSLRQITFPPPIFCCKCSIRVLYSQVVLPKRRSPYFPTARNILL